MKTLNSLDDYDNDNEEDSERSYRQQKCKSCGQYDYSYDEYFICDDCLNEYDEDDDE
jgi:hypothetical protein